MKIVHTIAQLRDTLAAYKRPTLVPTMGNLHEGHLTLVRQAKALGDCTVVSIFVNRLQFLPHEDFDQYPRTLQADCDKLQPTGCDVVFAPSEKELYPQTQSYKVHPPKELADILEGEFRPGFFVGVSTVVMKLFQCVQPSAAIFGRKDYQQFLVLKNMVQQFAMPIDVVPGETQRAADGLALSSRNIYLSAAERAQAVQLSQALQQVASSIRAGQPIASAEQAAVQSLQARDWRPDYITVRRRSDLQTPTSGDDLVVLAAARLGKTRLIDNLEF